MTLALYTVSSRKGESVRVAAVARMRRKGFVTNEECTSAELSRWHDLSVNTAPAECGAVWDVFKAAG